MKAAGSEAETAGAALERHRAGARERLRRAGVTRAGPGSVSWKVNAEIVVVAGWGRAILLQLAHPLVAAGVEERSGFRGSLSAGLARLRSTVDAMLALTFGDDEEAVATAAAINALHDRVRGRLPEGAGTYPAGEPYSAHDPELLRWVHATLLDSIPRAYALLVGPLTPEERDRYCAEAAVMEPLLGLPAGLLPRSGAQADAYLGSILGSGRIAVTRSSRALAHAALFPPRWRLLWPAFRPMQLVTVGLLPPEVRRAYGFAWTPREARALARWAAVLRAAVRPLPRPLRQWPAARHQRRAANLTPRRT